MSTLCLFPKFEIMPSSSKSNIYFFFDGVKVPLKNRTQLKRFIESIFKSEKRRLGVLNYVFCSDTKLKKINRQYLKHDYYTDIITFDLSETPGLINGEIYISVDRVKANSRDLNEYFTKELFRVIFHGVLHLCGYGDKSPPQIKKMRLKEEYYLNKYHRLRSM